MDIHFWACAPVFGTCSYTFIPRLLNRCSLTSRGLGLDLGPAKPFSGDGSPLSTGHVVKELGEYSKQHCSLENLASVWLFRVVLVCIWWVFYAVPCSWSSAFRAPQTSGTHFCLLHVLPGRWASARSYAFTVQTPAHPPSSFAKACNLCFLFSSLGQWDWHSFSLSFT